MNCTARNTDDCPNCGMPKDGPGLAFTDGTICNAQTHAGSVPTPEPDTDAR